MVVEMPDLMAAVRASVGPADVARKPSHGPDSETGAMNREE